MSDQQPTTAAPWYVGLNDKPIEEPMPEQPATAATVCANCGAKADLPGMCRDCFTQQSSGAICGYRPQWAALAPSWLFRCGKPPQHQGYHGDWT